jgi:uncharacterized membrane protein
VERSEAIQQHHHRLHAPFKKAMILTSRTNGIENMDSNSTQEISATQKIAYSIYVIYLIAIILPISPIIGVIFGYVFENDARDYLKTHYRYIIRSFWIGFLYSIIACTSLVIGIGVLLIPLWMIWWLIRSAKGLKSLMRKEPIAHPETWLF